jgi:hypothetical protein
MRGIGMSGSMSVMWKTRATARLLGHPMTASALVVRCGIRRQWVVLTHSLIGAIRPEGAVGSCGTDFPRADISAAVQPERRDSCSLPAN